MIKSRWVEFERVGQLKTRRTTLAALMMSGFLSSAGAAEDSAPFGFKWGPVGNVPRSSLAVREENITRLVYNRDRLPSDELTDTHEIVLEVCKTEGLQQVIWVSKVLSDSEEDVKFAAIVAKGTRRHGKPQSLEGGGIYWSVSRTTLVRVTYGGRRLLMVSAGPDLDACSKQHETAAGHSISDHWMRYVPTTGAR